MENNIYKDCFKKLVNDVPEETYIGRGNPNAKILFIGKEYSKPAKGLKFDAEYWAKAINDKEEIKQMWTYEDKENLPPGHTWKKYQKLHDYIFPDIKHSKKQFNFENRVFTTEMSEIPCKNTDTAQKNPEFKDKLKKRKETFFLNNEFLQQFPVVVLACSNYIKNIDELDELREVDTIFKVKFIEQHTVKDNYSFWIHHSTDKMKPKLVIHTRNLSCDVPNDLLERMGQVIREFLWNDDNDFRWNNGGKESYEKYQTIPDFDKTEGYKNYMDNLNTNNIKN